MADSLLRMVTGCAMRYSKRSPSSRPLAVPSSSLGPTLRCACGGHHGRGRGPRRRHGGLRGAIEALLRSIFRHLFHLVERARVHHRTGRRIVGQFRLRAGDIFRRVELADEGDGAAGDQREIHIGPVLAGGVIDDRPPFEHRRLVAEDQPVAGFPHRRGNHVAGGDVVRRGVAGIDIHAALVLGAGGGEHRQVILELLLDLGIGEAQSAGGGQIDGAEFAAVEQQIELVARGLFVGAGNAARADDDAGDGLRAELEFDARALQLIEHPGHAAVADLEGELGELVAERILRIVAQPGDFRRRRWSAI